MSNKISEYSLIFKFRRSFTILAVGSLGEKRKSLSAERSAADPLYGPKGEGSGNLPAPGLSRSSNYSVLQRKDFYVGRSAKQANVGGEKRSCCFFLKTGRFFLQIRGKCGTLKKPCRCDGIGRRSGLKIHRQRWRAGSTPASGTKQGTRHWPRALLVFLLLLPRPPVSLTILSSLCCPGKSQTNT